MPIYLNQQLPLSRGANPRHKAFGKFPCDAPNTLIPLHWVPRLPKPSASLTDWKKMAGISAGLSDPMKLPT